MSRNVYLNYFKTYNREVGPTSMIVYSNSDLASEIFVFGDKNYQLMLKLKFVSIVSNNVSYAFVPLVIDYNQFTSKERFRSTTFTLSDFPSKYFYLTFESGNINLYVSGGAASGVRLDFIYWSLERVY